MARSPAKRSTIAPASIRISKRSWRIDRSTRRRRGHRSARRLASTPHISKQGRYVDMGAPRMFLTLFDTRIADTWILTRLTFPQDRHDPSPQTIEGAMAEHASRVGRDPPEYRPSLVEQGVPFSQHLAPEFLVLGHGHTPERPPSRRSYDKRTESRALLRTEVGRPGPALTASPVTNQTAVLSYGVQAILDEGVGDESLRGWSDRSGWKAVGTTLGGRRS